MERSDGLQSVAPGRKDMAFRLPDAKALVQPLEEHYLGPISQVPSQNAIPCQRLAFHLGTYQGILLFQVHEKRQNKISGLRDKSVEA